LHLQILYIEYDTLRSGSPPPHGENVEGRNEVRWRPGKETSLASLCSNLRSLV